MPRGDGRYVLGATVEERGFDVSPTAGAVYELLREARELVPGVTRAGDRGAVASACARGRPDNLPAIGRGALEGLRWATGHYRNGILLAPLTAELLVGALLRRSAAAAEMLGWCDPARFARRAEARRAPGRGAAVIVLNGEPRELRAPRDAGGRARRAGRRARRARRRRRGRRRGGAARALAGVRAGDGARVEVLTAMQGG